MTNNKDKIVIATRTYSDGYEECVKKLEELLKINSISKGYIICDLHKEINNNIEVIFDKNPIRATAFNLVIDELNKDENKEKKYHLLTFSKEVDLHKENIEKMIEEIGKEKEKMIVVGYRLIDNVLSKEEYKQFANGNKNDNYGIAYQVPWNTCALWNEKFVYGENQNKLIFDEICEKDKNQLGELRVKVNGKILTTDYEGMEDGLAIAKLITNNLNENLKYKLIEEKLYWNIRGNRERLTKHKKKMARKNIVLSTFMNMKGYLINKLREANDKPKEAKIRKINSMIDINDKLQEANFFYDRMEEVEIPFVFSCYLSAFLSASRSVLQYLLKNVETQVGGQSWYDNLIKESKYAKYFKNKRDINIHQEIIKTQNGISIEEGEAKINYYFKDRKNDEDIMHLCKNYLDELQEFLQDGNKKRFLNYF